MLNGLKSRIATHRFFFVFLLALLFVLTSTFSCQKTPQAPGAPTSADSSHPSSSSPIESLAPNEIIWGALAGSPPEFIESGIDQGLGFTELQTKPIRKALIEAGYKIRYEYFSPARIAHEFSKKTPICFYPTEWRDPKKVFEKAPDRLYSVALDFKGEEAHTVIIRKEDASKFKKYLDPNGSLNLQALLLDPSLKTIFPKIDGLGPEFDPIYQSARDGSFEITPRYQRQIISRRLHDNDQLVRMLAGGSVDYLLDHFVIPEDFKVFAEGDSLFVRLAYQSNPVRSLLDPRVTLSSVTCGLSETTQRALPLINSVIRDLRGSTWSSRNLELRSGTGKVSAVTTLAHRFSNDLASEKADSWFPLQLKHLPRLEQSVQNSLGQLGTGAPQVANHPKTPRWLLLRPTQTSAWILPYGEAIDLAFGTQPNFDKAHRTNNQRSCQDLSSKAWSQNQLEYLKVFGEQLFWNKETSSGGTGIFSKIGSFEELIGELSPSFKGLASLSILARGLTGSQAQKLLPILSAGTLKSLDLVSGGEAMIKTVLPNLPNHLEHLNLFGSNLGKGELKPSLANLSVLRSVNLSCASLSSQDYFNSITVLPESLLTLRAGHHPLSWTAERATQLGLKRWPHLQVLDLEYSSIDDRHCSLLQVLPNSLVELNLSGNSLSSICLGPVLKKGFPSLTKLEVDTLRISSRVGLSIPPSVRTLDMSAALTEKNFWRVNFPGAIKSLQLAFSRLSSDQIAEVVKHLGPKLELLNLSDSTVDARIFKALFQHGVREIKDLRLNGNHLFDTFGKNFDPLGEELKGLKIEYLGLQNTRLSNSILAKFASALGRDLKGASLGQNLISTPGIQFFLEKAPHLQHLFLSHVLELDLDRLAENLPPSLRFLSLADNRLTDHDMEIFAKHFPPHLVRLDLWSSHFGRKGATALATALSTAQDLATLTIKSPIPESGWQEILTHLPADLVVLSLGQVSLGRESTDLMGKFLPKSLNKMYFDQVQLTVEQTTHWIKTLPSGLGNLVLLGFSLVETRSKSQRETSVPFPDSQRQVLIFSELGEGVLNTMIEALPFRNFDLYIKDSTLGERTALDLFQKHGPNLNVVELSRAKITPAMVQAFNQSQPILLSFSGSNFTRPDVSALTKKTLERLKVLAINATNLPGSQLIGLVKKLPPNMMVIDFQGSQLGYQDIDPLLAAIPAGTVYLNVSGTRIGPKGLEKVKAFARQREAESGIEVEVE